MKSFRVEVEAEAERSSKRSIGARLQIRALAPNSRDFCAPQLLNEHRNFSTRPKLSLTLSACFATILGRS